MFNAVYQKEPPARQPRRQTQMTNYKRRTSASGPQFVRFFGPVISALKELGNSGNPAEVRGIIARKLELSDAELNDPMSSGGARFDNRVAWARFYLSKAGYIDSSRRGVWSLTEKGIASEMPHEEALAAFHAAQKMFREEHAAGETQNEDDDQIAPTDNTIGVVGDYRSQLLEIIRNLPAAGFEQLCQRLLRESGFANVEVTGRTGDGGIDGRGILQINPFLSMQMIFQCKRYKGTVTVSASQIRDFRGAMAGRTDKGIFITTSTFTADAIREAQREGVPPIELVDAKKLIEMFEYLELGLAPVKAYAIDRKFFEEFDR